MSATITVRAMLQVHESATASGVQRVWMLGRNCALTPRQTGWFYLSLVMASTSIATVFLLRGAWMILPFSLLEMTALGAALLVYARHAVDRETVSLSDGLLEIESVDGGRRQIRRLDPRAVRVEMDARSRAELAVVSRGERLRIGRFCNESERRRVARELRHALSLAG